ncbi:hypothetical protein F2Q70_00036783 [Brassica cretica]|uniref:Uncharacterized protein n=1 Tax=Brassica cretica TaxID=69181 RepID=A0A8S9JZF8_BRACR|nr:hypothetical protein F2Q68_00032086 [Brassica cretica]KAF2586576.1 hypothetical protein F2Q70_00036783 [Brassica cretica]
MDLILILTVVSSDHSLIINSSPTTYDDRHQLFSDLCRLEAGSPKWLSEVQIGSTKDETGWSIWSEIDCKT